MVILALLVLGAVLCFTVGFMTAALLCAGRSDRD